MKILSLLTLHQVVPTCLSFFCWTQNKIF